MRDLRDAIRHWARTPVITAVVVLSLALGIGANTAIFSLIDSLLIKSLPVREPDRLVRVTEPNYNTLGVPVFRQITAAEVFESTAAMSLLRPDISNTLERRSAFGLAMNGGFFDTLGVSPAIGRLLTPEDDAVGAAAVAVTDYEFWQTEYGGRPDILGATIRLDGKPFTIVGVTERGFFGLNVGRRFDVAIAFNGYRTLFPDALDGIRNSFAVVGRLRDGQTAASAEAALRTLQPGIRAALQMPDNVPFLLKPVNVTSIASGLSTTTQEQYSKPLAVLMALVALVLADRVHERREPVDRPRQRPAWRTRRAPVARRHARPGAAIAPDREPRDRARQRRRGVDRRRVDGAGHRQRGRGEPERRVRELDRGPARLSRDGVHDRRRLPHRDRLRHRPRVVGDARRSSRRDASTRAWIDRRQQPVRRRAGARRVPGRPRIRARVRGQPAGSQLRLDDVAGPRLRSQARRRRGARLQPQPRGAARARPGDRSHSRTTACVSRRAGRRASSSRRRLDSAPASSHSRSTAAIRSTASGSC